jgi:DegT/DnrJ/EryC1/StrS aminotransferase family
MNGSGAAAERLLESTFSAPRALMVGRAALGLMAVLRTWRDERPVCLVAVPGAVCHEVILAIFSSGCQPAFCDVDPTTGLVTDSEWRRARLQGAEIAIVVHLYGNPASVSAVREIFPVSATLVIDDAAQALGSVCGGRPVGSAGDVGLLSFGHTKHISVGTAALLFREPQFASRVGAYLETAPLAGAELREALSADFRRRLDLARARVRAEGPAARAGFSGLLEGMEPVLRVASSPGACDQLLRQLPLYADAAQRRVAKAARWSQGLLGSPLVAVGMGMGCVPWRFTCRLPGSDWFIQHQLAEALRAKGMAVSNWYLPAHWFVTDAADLPGVERLSREVFQFWLDESISLESVARQAAMVQREFQHQAGLAQ